MKYKIECRPSYSLLRVDLAANDSIKAEGDAMVFMGENINIKTETGGVWKALKRSVLAGESLFLNTFTATKKSEIGLSSHFPGDIDVHKLSGILFVQPTSFLACSKDISIDTKFKGLKGFFGREGLFFLKLEGKGDIFFSTFGGILKKEIKQGEKFIIDTGYIVAYTEGLDFGIRTAGSLKTTILGKEGLVTEFYGKGTVYYQTKSASNFAKWLTPFIPRKTRG